METNNRIIVIIAKKFTTSLTKEEQEELNAWISSSVQNAQLYNRLIDKAYVSKKMRKIYAVDKKAGWKQFKKTYYNKEEIFNPIAFWKRPFVISFGLILLLLMGYWLLQPVLKNKNILSVSTQTKNETQQQTRAKDLNEILPITNKATLFLQNGLVTELDKAAIGLIAQVSSIQLNKEDEGQLKVKPIQTNFINEHEGQFQEMNFDTTNSITTPHDGQWKVILADGTIVWLNASSTLSFPLRFDEKERIVSLSGEAYFQVRPKVTPDGRTKIPFIVKINDIQVFVTGTEFNITAYANEKPVTTTLVNGSVELIKGTSRQLLKPGQQVEINKSGQFLNVKNANTMEAIAWKNKEIRLTDAPIEKVMDQIKRLYNVDIMYEADIYYHFNIDIPPNTPLSNALEILSLTGEVNFKSDGRKIIVTK